MCEYVAMAPTGTSCRNTPHLPLEEVELTVTFVGTET